MEPGQRAGETSRPYGENVARRVAQKILGDASHDDVSDAGPPVSTEDEKIRLQLIDLILYKPFEIGRINGIGRRVIS